MDTSIPSPAGWLVDRLMSPNENINGRTNGRRTSAFFGRGRRLIRSIFGLENGRTPTRQEPRFRPSEFESGSAAADQLEANIPLLRGHVLFVELGFQNLLTLHVEVRKSLSLNRSPSISLQRDSSHERSWDEPLLQTFSSKRAKQW